MTIAKILAEPVMHLKRPAPGGGGSQFAARKPPRRSISRRARTIEGEVGGERIESVKSLFPKLCCTPVMLYPSHVVPIVMLHPCVFLCPSCVVPQLCCTPVMLYPSYVVPNYVVPDCFPSYVVPKLCCTTVMLYPSYAVILF